MTEIIRNDLLLISLEQQRNFVWKDKEKNKRYYIYSAVREWAIEQLMDEGLK